MKKQFVELRIGSPGFYMQLKATKERLNRITDFILKEALEAEAEYEAHQKDPTRLVDVPHEEIR